MKIRLTTKALALSSAFSLTVLTGCSSSPLTENDFRIDNARAQFEEQREKKRSDQPIAIKPSETPKVERAMRVLRVLRGSGAGSAQVSNSVSVDGQLDSIESGLQALAEQLIAEATQVVPAETAEAAPEPIPGIGEQDPSLPTQILEDGYVYVSTNSVKFEPTQITNSFAKMYMQGFAKDSRGDYTASGLPLEIAIQELAKAASVDLTIATSDLGSKSHVSFNESTSAAEILDQLLITNDLAVIWDPETERAWIIGAQDYQALMAHGEQHAKILSEKRDSLRASFEQRELQNLATMVQNLALDIARGKTDQLVSGITQIEDDFVELRPQTRVALTPQIVSLRKNVNAFANGGPAEATQSQSGTTASITTGEAAVEFTSCLPKGETVKVVKIFTSYIKPEEVRNDLNGKLGGIAAGSSNEGAASTEADDANNAQAETAQGPGAAAGPTGCAAITELQIDHDNTGIIVTARDSQIDYISNLLDGIDTPKKQVLVEVYLVQVTADWRRQLEANLATLTTNGEISTALGASLVNITRSGTRGAFTLTGSDTPGTGLGNILTFLERNDIGRTISSPSILAIDGQEANVTRKRTLKYTETVPATLDDNGNPVQAAGTTIEEIELNLELNITPTVVQANNHVILDFKLVEDTIDDETSPDSSPQTTNDIDTRIETSPGDVVMLAGLYRQATSDTVDGLPGLTGSGTIAGLTGGASSLFKNQSELLVFIAPTVLEPGNTAAAN